MADSLVDGAAILGCLEALDCRSPETTPVWAYRSIVEVTTVLLLVPRIVLSPIPELHAAAIGPYGRILTELSSFLDQTPVPEATRRVSMRSTQRWGRENPDKLRASLDGYREDASYQHWIDWLARNQWPDHARRHGGLFEQAFVTPISRVLAISNAHLEEIRESSVSTAQLARLVSRPDEEKSRIVRDAFTISTLLRGRYYEYLSRKSDRHVLHHVIRTPILDSLPASRRVSAPITNTAWFLSVILVASAFSSQTRARHHAWSSAVRLAREGINAGLIDATEKTSDEVAITVAARAASQLDIRFHPRWVDSVLNAALSAGVGGLASIGITSFDSIVFGFATDILLEGTSPVERLTRKVSGRSVKLESLARLGAGRITPDWT
jgi:hypothetical protein